MALADRIVMTARIRTQRSGTEIFVLAAGAGNEMARNHLLFNCQSNSV
jgi:hypothetical protein